MRVSFPVQKCRQTSELESRAYMMSETNHTPSGLTHSMDETRKRIRVRLMVAIPVVTSLPLLALGIVVKDLGARAGVQPEVVALKPVMSYFLAAAVAAILAGITLAYAITSRIAWLTFQTLEVARGDVTRTVNTSLGKELTDEIGLLGDAFNDMLASLNRYILESMTGGVMTVDERGTVTSFNSSAEVILGRPARDVVGRPLAEVFGNDRSNREFLQAVSDAVQDRHTRQSSEVRIQRGGSVLTIGLSTSLLRNEQGTVVGVVATFKDVTEIQRIRDQMRRAERLGALGTLAAGIAHEIRNPLGALQGLAQLLDESLEAEHPRKKYTQTMLKETRRLNRIIEDLLDFAHPCAGEFEPTDLNAVVQGAARLACQELAPGDRMIIESYGEGLPPLPSEEDRLVQVFLNLIRNAIEATADGGTIEIQTRRCGHDLQVVVANDGPTIDAEHVDHLFDPFFTTKKEGTGLGLAIADQIVNAHHGDLGICENRPGRVAFRVNLPLQQPEARTQ